MSRDYNNAQVVNSVAEEYEIIQNTNCECGGGYRVLKQSLMGNEGKNYDVIACKCTECEKETEFIFDIDSFFGKGFDI